jgi:hypothetical protein
MNLHHPPKLAMYLLNRFGSPYHRESLAGDLFEQFQSVRSARWFWQQVLSAIVTARIRELGSRHWSSLAKRVLRIVNAIMLAAAITLGMGTLTKADSPTPSCALQVRC